jgi:hypothetical protein
MKVLSQPDGVKGSEAQGRRREAGRRKRGTKLRLDEQELDTKLSYAIGKAVDIAATESAISQEFGCKLSR